MPTDDEAAFLRAIAAAPGDLAPRLVFADWLDEHGRGPEAAYYRLPVAKRFPPAGAGAFLPRGLPVAEFAPEEGVQSH